MSLAQSSLSSDLDVAVEDFARAPGESTMSRFSFCFRDNTIHSLAVVESLPISGDGRTRAPESASSLQAFNCTPVQGMLNDANRTVGGNVRRVIEASKIHWSDVRRTAAATTAKTNLRIFQSLHKKYGDFFTTDGRLLMGRQIGEGAQAAIFEADYLLGTKRYSVVLKVFKEGSSMYDLQKQWPRGMLRNCRHGPYVSASGNFSSIWGATLLSNGRFAFWMERYWGDLRRLIDRRLGNQQPFLDCEVAGIMRDIAKGMRDLHHDGIVHRDLKASNVLVKLCRKGPRTFKCLVADYECSNGVMGTRFWRAPEILQALRARSPTQHLFTEKSDVFSYGMTCYEVVTGQIPLDDVSPRDYEVVIQGARPALPKRVQPLLATLLQKCWLANPAERPSFDEILKSLPSIKTGSEGPGLVRRSLRAISPWHL